jgi:hypothetical protein
MWPSDCKHVEHAANFTNTHPGRLLGTLFSDDPIRERIRTALQRRNPIASRCESCLFRSRNGNFRVGHTSGARVDSFNTNQENGGIRRFGTARFQVRRLVYEGDPEAQIVATAEAETVQLVIMPTHGYGVFRRFLLGSVTSKVLHDLSCPMLTGAHLAEQGGTGKIAISNIVCAIDRGVESRDTLEWASKLAADFQAALSVVHGGFFGFEGADGSDGQRNNRGASRCSHRQERDGMHSGGRGRACRVRLRQVCRSPLAGHRPREGSAHGPVADQRIWNHPAISLPGTERLAGDLSPD